MSLHLAAGTTSLIKSRETAAIIKRKLRYQLREKLERPLRIADSPDR